MCLKLRPTVTLLAPWRRRLADLPVFGMGSINARVSVVSERRSYLAQDKT
jgi:hypothetical protein